MFWGFSSLNILSGLTTPLLRSTLSFTATEQDQGLLLTGIAAMETISGIWGPLVFATIYAKTEEYNHEIVMYTMTGVAGVTVLLSGYLLCSSGGGGGDKMRRKKKEEEEELLPSARG